MLEENTNFVLDASIALAWVDESRSTDRTNSLLQKIKLNIDRNIVHVPSLWYLEVGNALLAAKKREELTKEEYIASLNFLGNIPIKIDQTAINSLFEKIIKLAESNNLTSYDASYLELAKRLNISLATNDKALMKAAKKEGIKLI